MPNLQAFQRAAERLKQDQPHFNTRLIRLRGLRTSETCLEFLNRQIGTDDPTYWQSALDSGRLKLNGQILTRDTLLRTSDQLTHTTLESPEPAIQTNIKIIFEDEALLVIDKPSGLPVHPCGRYHYHTLTKIMQEAWPELNLHLVHRLDAQTSGLLVLAKTQETARNLTRQFEHRSIRKTYLAQVSPEPPWKEHTCETPISQVRGPLGRRFCDNHGQPAKTDFNHLGGGLVEAMPVSGRTNQIRVHLASLDHPIIGDAVYGGKPSDNLKLHAWKIEFYHPMHETKLLLMAPTRD